MTRDPVKSVTKIAKSGPASMLQMGFAERTAGNRSIDGARLGRYAPDSVVRTQVEDYRCPIEVGPEIENGMSSTAVFAK